MSRREPPNQAQPVVQRLRLRYTKDGRMRFASHRDFQRALERAVRRCGLPIAYSGGFSPHPRIAYANAAPTGAASHAEYLELGMREPVDPVAVRGLLSAALPAGFAIADCVLAESGSLADRLEASQWRLDLDGVSAADAGAALSRLEVLPDVVVHRVAKSGVKQIDVSAAVLHGQVADVASPRDGRPCAILHVVVRHTTPAVRPEDVLSALVERADLPAPAAVVYTRMAQGPLRGDPPAVADPLSEDRRDVAGPPPEVPGP